MGHPNGTPSHALCCLRQDPTHLNPWPICSRAMHCIMYWVGAWLLATAKCKHSSVRAARLVSSCSETQGPRLFSPRFEFTMVGKRYRRDKPDGKHVQNLGQQLQDPAQNGVRVSPAAACRGVSHKLGNGSLRTCVTDRG